MHRTVEVRGKFRNLLSNAIKFKPNRKKIIISIKPFYPDDGPRDSNTKNSSSIVMSIKDEEGPGIPEHELDSIFDKYIQNSTTKTGAGSTGFGLAICKEIVKAHKSKFWSEINSKGGSTFSFMLPYTQAPNNGPRK
jgi:signal transduction histidine kinase